MLSLTAFTVLVTAALLIMATQVSTSVRARELSQRSHDRALTLSSRYAAALAATRLRPSVLAYRKRALVLRSESGVALGDLDGARQAMFEAWSLDRTDRTLRERLRVLNHERFLRDSRKAHVLHGREKPGGVLYPEDLLP